MQQREGARSRAISTVTARPRGVMSTRKRTLPMSLLLMLAVALFATGPDVAEEAYAAGAGCSVPGYAGGGNAIDGDFLTEPGGAISRCENGSWLPYLSSGPPPCGSAQAGLHWYTPYGPMRCDGLNWAFVSQEDPGCSAYYEPGLGAGRLGQLVSLTSPGATTMFAHCGSPHGGGRGLWHHPGFRPSSRDTPAYPGYSPTVLT